jgi:polysaccharide pyruvyl transferase WcaK-like protein
MNPNARERLRVACFGYNGVNNTGSEAKLLTTLRTISEVIGDRLGELIVLTIDKKNQRRYLRDYPNARMIEISPWIPIRSPRFFFAGGLDLLVLSEGSTFIDHFSSMFMMMFCSAALWAKCRGSKVVAYANDCGHLKPINQRILRQTLNKIDLILLRNPDAAARMREYGVTRDITVTADGAYEYPLPPEEYRQRLFRRLGLTPGRRPLIGIAPKEFFWWPVAFRPFGRKEDLYMYPFYHTWARGGKESSVRYVAQSARHADWCVETYDADVVLISMEHMDYPPTRRIHDAMKHRDRAVIVSSDEYTVDDIVSVLSILTALITTRYHAVVLSSASAVPVIAVSSDTRCEAVFKELGYMDRYIDYARHPDPTPRVHDLDERLIETTRDLFSRLGETRERIAAMHPQFVARARRNKEIFSQWFAENFPLP